MFAGLKDKLADLARVKLSKSEYVKLFAESITDEPWGPTVPQMDKLVEAYPQGYEDLLTEIQTRFDNRKSNWLRAFKSLLVVDHLARNLAPRFVDDLRSFLPTIREISTSFFFTDDRGVDRGASVRERSKKIIALLTDNDLLAAEREKTEKARASTNEAHGGGSGAGGGRYSGFGSGGGAAGAQHGDYDGHGSAGSHHHQQQQQQQQQHGHHHGSGDSRYGGYGSDDLSPAAMEKKFQVEIDMELARKLQEEEDRAAAAAHIPTSGEVYRDRELAKQLAGGASQQTAPRSKAQQQNNQFADFKTPPAGVLVTGQVVKNNNSSMNNSNAGGGGGRTSLDDLFGSAVPVRTGNNNNSNNQQQQQDIFGAFAGPGTSSSSSSTTATAYATGNQSQQNQFSAFAAPQPAPAGGNNATSSGKSSDAFAVLAGMGGAGSSKPQQRQQHAPPSSTNNVLADIFGSPVGAPKPKPAANDGFPF